MPNGGGERRAMSAARTPEQIRAEIKRVVQRRRKAEAARRAADEELRELLRQVQATPGVTMKEAARVAGVTRGALYKILDRG